MAHKNRTNISPYKTRQEERGQKAFRGSAPGSNVPVHPGGGKSRAGGPKSGSLWNPDAPSAKSSNPELSGRDRQSLAVQGKKAGTPKASGSPNKGPVSQIREISNPPGTPSRHKRPDQIYGVEEASDRLRDLFGNHGMGHITHPQRHQLAQFYRLLMLNQEKENFTRLLKFTDIGIKHFVDCLMVPELTKLKFPLMDMGTGPGLPGIPLKILYPDQKIILAEGVQRRVEFVKHVREEMNLKNLDIIGRNINPYFMYPVQGVITRAVEDVRNTLKNVLSCLQTGGRVYLMKGPNVGPELEVAESEVGEFYRLVEDIPYSLPKTSHERRLVIYEKIKMAPLPDLDDEPWPED